MSPVLQNIQSDIGSQLTDKTHLWGINTGITNVSVVEVAPLTPAAEPSHLRMAPLPKIALAKALIPRYIEEAKLL